ncbi:MAG: STAS domain-containing protein [Bacteroidota bacterium]
MALEIKENKGLYRIYGKVTSQNIGALRIYFTTVLEAEEGIVISLEYLASMDAAAALFFEALYKQAVQTNKVVTIIGAENRNIEEIMVLTKTNYILSSDRI